MEMLQWIPYFIFEISSDQKTITSFYDMLIEGILWWEGIHAGMEVSKT